jgi:signal transduction histidine kinase
VTLSVFCEETSRDGNSEKPIRWVVFAVTDHGEGIDPKIEPKIFDPFFSTRSKQTSAGLGLAVAQGLVQQMNGVLRYSSQPGHTVFRVMLPACAT